MSMDRPRLSFCIATYNRADFLEATLDSIIAQATSECEIVVSDNASTDNTEQVVAERARRFPRLRYFRQERNQGIDRNFDRAVELASGEYCWPLPDDDLLKADAVATVLGAMHADLSLIVVNVEFVDFTLSRVIQRGVDFQSDRTYEPAELDRLYVAMARLNGYIGSFVIRRSIWIARDRARYFGSDFLHIGVIYQKPLPGSVLVIARPLVSMRMGNSHAWWSRLFDQCMNARSLCDSLALSDSAKRSLAGVDLWKSPLSLLWLRAIGAYSWREYRQQVRPKLRSIREKIVPLSVAVLPGAVVHFLFVAYFRVTRRSWGGSSPDWYLQILSESRVQHRAPAPPPGAQRL